MDAADAGEKPGLCSLEGVLNTDPGRDGGLSKAHLASQYYNGMYNCTCSAPAAEPAGAMHVNMGNLIEPA